MSDLSVRERGFKVVASAEDEDGSTKVVTPGGKEEFLYKVKRDMRLESLSLFDHENGRADVRVVVILNQKIEGEIRWSSMIHVDSVQVKMRLPRGSALGIRLRNISTEPLLARILLQGTWLEP